VFELGNPAVEVTQGRTDCHAAASCEFNAGTLMRSAV